ncbi:hypothetical protein L6Q96_10860 [Candidatus Binatia bacterium]|nr:hypothetical protein [Candidatus Binatia bacterium]
MRTGKSVVRAGEPATWSRIAACVGLAIAIGWLGTAVPARAAVVCVPNDGIDGSCTSGLGAATIGAGVALAAAGGGDTVLVDDGAYVENVGIDRQIVLKSRNGRALTTITGITNGALGTIRITAGVNGVQIGDIGQGFTIVGIDNPSPGLESAAVYFQGNHAGAVVSDNEIVAAGDAGLMTEYGATISSFVISGNTFSGQTFTGANPAGCGFGSQWTLANVPRQLVVISGGSGGGSHSGITFTGNVVSGTAGGCSSSGIGVGGCTAVGQEQGNTLVTIDASGATISGNTFSGTTARSATSFRARGPSTTVSGNSFISTGLVASCTVPTAPLGTGHVYTQATGQTVGSLVAANGFDRGVYVDGPDGTVALSIEAVAGSPLLPASTTVEVLAGTYAEQVSITVSGTTVNAQPGALVRPATVVTDTTQGSPCSNGNGTAIVLVSGATGVTLNNLSVDGSLAAAFNPTRFVGIYYRNASGAINGGSVTNIRNDPLDGVQGGLGILVQAKGPDVADVDIAGVAVSGYQKNGVTFNGCGCADTPDGLATGSITGATVTGAGATPLIAQNGVQVGFGAGPVTISGNVISGHRYIGDPDNGTGAGVLIFSAKNNVITSNSVAQNNSGIVFAGGDFSLCSPGDATGNTASCNLITGHDQVIANPDDLPNPFTESGVASDTALNTVEDNSITGNAIGVDASSISLGSLDAEDNWWGCVAGPGNAGCDSVVGSVNFSPFRTTPSPCVACTQDSDCDDGVGCNGVETCNIGGGVCVPGTPVVCGDGNECTSDACVEPAGSCPYALLPNGSACSSGACQDGLCSIAGLSVGYLSLNQGQVPNTDRIRLRAELDATTGPTFVDDVDNNGAVLVVESTVGTVATLPFTGAQCTVKRGSIHCKDAATKSYVRFSKRRVPLFFRVRAVGNGLTFSLPGVGQTPLRVRVQTVSNYTERQDTIASCAARGARILACRDVP